MKYLHIKTGGFYELLHIAVTADTLKPAVVYQNDDGVVFVRLASEFFDGRFEPVITNRSPFGDLSYAGAGLGIDDMLEDE